MGSLRIWRAMGCIALCAVACTRPQVEAHPTSQPAAPQPAPKPKVELPHLEAVLQSIAAEQQYHASPPALPSTMPLPPDPIPAINGLVAKLDTSQQSIDALTQEVTALREEVANLRQSMAERDAQSAADLKRQNDDLRAENMRLQVARSADGADGDVRVPIPGGPKAIEPAAQPQDGDPRPLVSPEAMAQLQNQGLLSGGAKKPKRTQPFLFVTVKEWGRSPQDAVARGGKTTSLLGMVGTVPEGSSDEELSKLGRELRARYADYDNINIEVFDSKPAAQKFADAHELDAEHNVLSISRFPAKNRDVILLQKGGASMEVPFDPKAGAAAAAPKAAPAKPTAPPAPDPNDEPIDNKP